MLFTFKGLTRLQWSLWKIEGPVKIQPEKLSFEALSVHLEFHNNSCKQKSDLVLFYAPFCLSFLI